MTYDEEFERRILILTPTGRDGPLVREVFERLGITAVACSDLDQVTRALDEGAGALLVAEEAVAQDAGVLVDWLERQSPWSDLPILVLSRPGADSAAVTRAMDLLRNITVLERPVRVAALISAVRTSLRSRERQYQLRRQLIELQEAEAALRIEDERKNEFLAVLAHELRNPLAPIRNASHIIRNLAGHDTQLTTVSEMMDRQVTHLVRLVDDLMEVSRISRGRIELRTERVELGSIIRGAVESCRPLIDACGHELAVTIPDDPLILDADATRLGQVFANLLNNAAKYTDARGTISIIAERLGREAVVSVRDSGSGLAPEVLSRVFDMFVQGAPTGDRAQGGLGIGLTLARSLVELHGGTVQARSDGVGCGSEFVVRLPLAVRDRTSKSVTEKPACEPDLAETRVMIVDDNHDAADSLGALLAARHAAVQIVYSGSETLDVIDAFDPNAMVVDIGMPGMDGYELARCVRRHPRLGHVTLIALTGWGQEADRRRTEAAGFDHHLTKPADVLTLERLLAASRTAPQPS